MTNFNEQYTYQPYKGGAGPTEEETTVLNDLVKQVLTDLNIQFTTRNATDGMDIVGEIIHVGEKEVSYDRWGYCSADGDLDQADLSTTIAYLQD